MLTVRSIITAVALTAAIAACTGDPGTQVLTGRVDRTKGALAIRAISDGDVVTAGQVRSDGSFTLVLPAGSQYRLEVLTSSGVRNVVARDGAGLRDLMFKVCEPRAPFDVGGIADPGNPMCAPDDPNCKYDCEADGTCPPPCDPATNENCPPPPCADPNDPNCKCEADGTCPPPPCEPGDPSCTPCDQMDPNGNCPPPPCAPDDPNCMPCAPDDPSCMPCDPSTDPYCKCDANGNCGGGGGMCTDPNDPSCAPPCSDPNDPNCMPPGCDANGTCECTDPNDPGCAPPCADPMDPTSCKDPCVDDPASCGCMANDPNCWPAPTPCECDSNGMCEPDGTMTPEHVPQDFGCP